MSSLNYDKGLIPIRFTRPNVEARLSIIDPVECPTVLTESIINPRCLVSYGSSEV